MRSPFLGIVAEDFEGIEEGELTLVAGTYCMVATCEDDGWWSIHTKDFGHGIFPGSYVDEIEEINLPCNAKVQKTIHKNNIPVGKIVKLTAIEADGFVIYCENVSTKCTWDYIDITTEEPESPKKQLESPKDSKIKLGKAVEQQETGKTKANVNFATVKTRGPSQNTNIPKEKRTSTYKRPVSIFGEFKINSTFDIVFDKENTNLYSVDPNRRKNQFSTLEFEMLFIY